MFGPQGHPLVVDLTVSPLYPRFLFFDPAICLHTFNRVFLAQQVPLQLEKAVELALDLW
jgi:hypothetical protein